MCAGVYSQTPWFQLEIRFGGVSTFGVGVVTPTPWFQLEIGGVGSWVKNLAVECGSFCWRFIRSVVVVSCLFNFFWVDGLWQD